MARVSRNLSLTDVEAVAQGRVWTGAQAKENGLVDEIGSLSEAIAYARCTCDAAKEAEVVAWPKKMSFFESLWNRKQEPSGSVSAYGVDALTPLNLVKVFSNGSPPNLFYSYDENTAIHSLLESNEYEEKYKK